MNSREDARTGVLQRARAWAGSSAALPRIAVALLIAGIPLVFPGFMTVLFVVGGKFIPWWMAAGALFALAAILVSVQVSARRSVPEADAFKWSEVQIRWFWTPLTLCSAFCVIGMGLDALNHTRYSVVAENSTGCKLVASESTFFGSGSGTMFMAEPWGVAFRSSSWMVNEGDRPARDGEVRVRWAGTAATYSVPGAFYDPDAGYARSARCWTEALTN